ncbi:hypothetical protein [Paraburkholderia sp. SIMBA_054]|uniref:hypothetical protein n=1 Tax=Paraburkholderia sp. SIMBA_054 TaxID=3085795 RepID=UPI00397E1CAC
MGFFTRKPRVRPINPFLEPWEMTNEANVISLPRIAQIADRRLHRDDHAESMCVAWKCHPLDFRYDEWIADHAFQPGWHVRAAEDRDLVSELVDNSGALRAEIVNRQLIDGYSILSILPRFYVTAQHDPADNIRVVALDRRDKRVMRQTRWMSPSEHKYVKHLTTEYAGWLDELKPNHRDPFAYWSEA